MKMKELEARTGVGRETIRYYIREGLLPEPERPKTNVAIYSEEHVRRLELIRTLQRERFLPLGIIRRLIEHAGGREPDRVPGLFGLEFMLAARLGAESSRAPMEAEKVAAESRIPIDEIRRMGDEGIITLIEDAAGKLMMSAHDAAILHTWGHILALGFSREVGYTIDTLREYYEAAEALAELEVTHFYDRLSEKLDADSAAAMTERGIPLGLEMFGQFRLKAILQRVAERNAAALAASDDNTASSEDAASSTETGRKHA